MIPICKLSYMPIFLLFCCIVYTYRLFMNGDHSDRHSIGLRPSSNMALTELCTIYYSIYRTSASLLFNVLMLHRPVITSINVGNFTYKTQKKGKREVIYKNKM